MIVLYEKIKTIKLEFSSLNNIKANSDEFNELVISFKKSKLFLSRRFEKELVGNHPTELRIVRFRNCFV